MIKNTLRELGLTDNEVTIYMTLLPLGTVAASVLGQRTDIVRSTARYVCQQLVKKGLFFESKKGNTALYTPESPDKILYLLEQQKKDLQTKEEQANRIIGELKSMMNRNIILPKVKFYEGKKGIMDLYEEMLALREPIDSFEDKGEMMTLFPDFANHFVESRKKYKIRNRVICPSTNKINLSTPKDLREVRTIPESEYPFSCDIKICENQVSIVSFQENALVGIAIKHKDIAENFRLLFNYFWKHLTS